MSFDQMTLDEMRRRHKNELCFTFRHLNDSLVYHYKLLIFCFECDVTHLKTPPQTFARVTTDRTTFAAAQFKVADGCYSKLARSDFRSCVIL
jgi:hypothetical protein